MKGTMKTVLRLAIFLALATAAAGQGQSKPLSVSATISSESAYVGEAIQLRIVVSGTTQAEQPDMTGLTDFSVTPAGSGPQSRVSMQIANGRAYKSEEKSYTFVYQIAPKQIGTLTIPSIEVKAGGQSFRTQSIQIIARKPTETAEFKLRATLSKNQAYAGEPLIMDWFFYYQTNADSLQVTIPALDDPAFFFYDLDAPNNNQTGMLDGQEYRIFRVRKAMIPKRPGDFQIPASTFAFRGVSGYEMQRDVFGRPVKAPRYKNFAVPSNELALKVLDVPSQGRPANFAGHIGSYRINASATPTKVNVGDPITLTIAIDGPQYLAHVGLPALGGQANLARDFRVPDEMSAGEIQGNYKVFKQTIRASNAQVRQIPAIELPFFDTQSGTYQIARSTPIPIAVQATRIVTAADAEGTGPATTQMGEIEEWSSGIAHNYEGDEALRNQSAGAQQLLGSTGFIGTLAIPPLGFVVVLLVMLSLRRRAADPEGARERKALRGLSAELGAASSSDDVLAALKSYLGGKLRLPSGALTIDDIREPLTAKNVGEETIGAVARIFEQCEASRYAGGDSSEDISALASRCREVAAKIESALSKRGGFRGLGKGAALIVAVLISIPGLARADRGSLNDFEISQLFKQGNDLFRQANSLTSADPAQAEQLYRGAILRFERIFRESDVRNGQLFYNIGNAYFRIDELGKAILNYRRAEELTPNDSNLQQNLEFARSRRADPIEEKAQKRILETVFFWHYDFSSSTRAWIFGIAFVAIWVAAGTRLFIKRSFLNWIIGIASVIAAVFLASLVVEARAASQTNPGVILVEEVIARKGDSETYEPSFSKPLHAGTEFDVLETRAGWFRVELADGRECWLPAQAAGLVRNQS
ncbi:MAG: tetratricopeptide (TPR) repeat protein [Verrucomicrobiales bacterium]|jgi:tetratricopeptide (TPR) repeat protein